MENMDGIKIAVRYCGGCNPGYQRGDSVRALQKKFPKLQLSNFDPADEYKAVLVVCGCSARCAGQSDLPPALPRLALAAPEDFTCAAAFLEEMNKEC